MAHPNIHCDDGNTNCYYVYTDSWHIWGRWVMLACLVLFFVALIIFSGWAMSRRRMQIGMAPILGFAWMFSNPYKLHQQKYPEVPPHMAPQYEYYATTAQDEGMTPTYVEKPYYADRSQ